MNTIVDPYRHFYEMQKVVEDSERTDEEIQLDWDQYQELQPDIIAIGNFLESQIEEASKTKEKWLTEAMKYDPAFMLEPIENYYKTLIPETIVDKLNNNDLQEVLSLYDPVTWGMRYLRQKHGGWKPRTSNKGLPYQAQLIRCKSRRMVARAGRRIGKSQAMVVRALHRAFTWTETKTKSRYNIVIFTPNQSQINTIFKMMEELIDNNPILLNEIKNGGKMPTRKSPLTTLEFKNGVTIYGYVSGSTSVRSSAADYLILDEASFLGTEDIDSVIALLAENNETELWVSSTPKGLRDWFYERTRDTAFVSFYFPTDQFHPFWSKEMHDEFKSQLTDSGYRHEVLADFSADGEGVFQIKFIDAAQVNYDYGDDHYDPNCFYGMGVDWNSPQNGTQIYVVAFDPSISKYKIVDKASVSIDGWTQLGAVEEIKKLNRKWQPVVIYLDEGHGSTQIELLHEWGAKAPKMSIERNLLKAKAINFSSSLEIRDPWSKQTVKKTIKPYMINNAVRVFEDYNIIIPSTDYILIKQLEGYAIDYITPKNVPVYKPDGKYGDHALDALVLALLGFHMEYSSLSKPRLASNIGYTNLQGATVGAVTLDPFKNPRQSEVDVMLMRDKAREKEIFLEANSHKINYYEQDVKLSSRLDGKMGLVKITKYSRPKNLRRTF